MRRMVAYNHWGVEGWGGAWSNSVTLFLAIKVLSKKHLCLILKSLSLLDYFNTL